MQSNLSSFETLKAVQNFEKIALDNGIIIKEYQSDNGSAFTSKMFKDHLEQQGQTSIFSGAGSHHQNGTAERNIQTIMAMAQTMLLHAAIHWSDVAADPTVWPLAVRHAVWIHNRIPNVSTGLSPMDTWSRTRFPLHKLHLLHIWGCPTCVLEKRLADGKSLGRWQPRAQRMMWMGFSDKHSSDVPFVLNPYTGSITPQWNVVVDDWFATIATSANNLPAFDADEWSKMFGTYTYNFPMEEGDVSKYDDPTLSSSTSVKQEMSQKEEGSQMEEISNLQQTPIINPQLPTMQSHSLPSMSSNKAPALPPSITRVAGPTSPINSTFNPTPTPVRQQSSVVPTLSQPPASVVSTTAPQSTTITTQVPQPSVVTPHAVPSSLQRPSSQITSTTSTPKVSNQTWTQPTSKVRNQT